MRDHWIFWFLCLWLVGCGSEIAPRDMCSCRVRNCVLVTALTPDQRFLITGNTDGVLRWWEVATGNQIAAWDMDSKGMYHDITSIAFSRNGHRLISSDGNNVTRVWDTQTGTVIQTFLPPVEAAKGGIHTVSVLSADGTTAITTGLVATVWDVATGHERLRFTQHTQSVTTVAWSPDGTLIATGSDDKTIRLWNVETGVQQAVLRGHTREIREVAFSPDGQWLASASDTAYVWEVQSGKSRSFKNAGGYSIFYLAWSSDGQRLLMGSAGSLIDVWEWQGNTVTKYRLSEGCGGSNVAFSPDEQHFLVAIDMPYAVWYDPLTRTVQPIGQNPNLPK